MSDVKSSGRSARLRTLFAKILNGNDIISQGNAKLFLEAISDQADPTICIQRLVGSPYGLTALQSSFSSDNTPTFFNGPVAKFLIYLEAPRLKTICGGEVLRQVISKLIEVPITWNSLIQAAKSEKLDEKGIEAFSCLLLRLLSLPKDKAIAHAAIAQDSAVQKLLLESSYQTVRSKGQRIVHIARNLKAECRDESSHTDQSGPGGRHDNDFAQIRKISILPTPDELVSKNPYLPRAIDMENSSNLPEGFASYIDGQFRLLREDMLRDLREEIKSALDPKMRRRKAFFVENLGMIGINGDERQPWSLRLQCLEDLPQLRNKKNNERKTFLKDNPRILKHDTMACLLADDEIVTLGIIVRDENLLALIPPILSLQIPSSGLERALLRLQNAKNIKMIQLNTALFAYEPVLKQLQEMKELSLEDEIFRWEQGKNISPPNYTMDRKIFDTVNNLTTDSSYDLKDLLQLPSSTKLDESQAACFLAGVQQKVVTIQGPPGELLLCAVLESSLI
jgi:hypothetical protein